VVTKKAWTLFVVIVGGILVVSLCVWNRFVPGAKDMADPLGTPTNMAESIVHSASEFDRITGILVPKHAELGERMQMMNTMTNNLDHLVNRAAYLGPMAITVNKSTTTVQGVANPLPQLISAVTGRAQQATPAVGVLSAAVASVVTQLQAVGVQLEGIHGNLSALSPKATSIVALLSQIQAESLRLRPVGPLLSLLADVTRAPNGQPLFGLLSGG